MRLVEEKIASAPLSHWEALFSQADACCAPVRRLEETLEDPLFQGRGLFFALEGHGQRFFQVATPVTPARREGFTSPPVVGQHTREALAQVMEPGAVEALLRDGVALQSP
jgi:crotonobetainyl-CoA:carnitine CoA-transferase CaiB-like acyl-CoA transferase